MIPENECDYPPEPVLPKIHFSNFDLSEAAATATAVADRSSSAQDKFGAGPVEGWRYSTGSSDDNSFATPGTEPKEKHSKVKKVPTGKKHTKKCTTS